MSGFPMEGQLLTLRPAAGVRSRMPNPRTILIRPPPIWFGRATGPDHFCISVDEWYSRCAQSVAPMARNTSVPMSTAPMLNATFWGAHS